MDNIDRPQKSCLRFGLRMNKVRNLLILILWIQLDFLRQSQSH